MAPSSDQETVAGGEFCSVAARRIGEELWGTATRVDVWLLLEYASPWGREAFEESDLPGPVKGWLSDQLTTIPRSRLQLIRRPETRDGIRFFVGIAREVTPALYEIRLSAYEELITLDPPAIIAGERRTEGWVRREPLFLVCTNGRRDLCCAKFGLPVYQALAELAPQDAWRTTHLGGHRFAPTALFLPHGVAYGRITEGDVARLVAAYHQERMVLSHLRGRSCYDPIVQAADYFLRRETGFTALPRFRLGGVETLTAAESEVTFLSDAGGRHRLRVRQEEMGLRRYASCAAESPTTASRYRLVAHARCPDPRT